MPWTKNLDIVAEELDRRCGDKCELESVLIFRQGNKEEGLRHAGSRKNFCYLHQSSNAPPCMRSVQKTRNDENGRRAYELHKRAQNEESEEVIGKRVQLLKKACRKVVPEYADLVRISPTPLTSKDSDKQAYCTKCCAVFLLLFSYYFLSLLRYSPSAFFGRDRGGRKHNRPRRKKEERRNFGLPSTLTSRKSSVRNNSDSSSNVTINNRDAAVILVVATATTATTIREARYAWAVSRTTADEVHSWKPEKVQN